METYTDNREFARAVQSLPVEVRGVEGVLIEGRVRDISLNGVCIQADRLLPVGIDCEIVIPFSDEAENRVRVTLAGRVIRAEGETMAVSFRNAAPSQLALLRHHVPALPESLKGHPQFESR